MGVLRLGIIVAVGVALLPSDSEQQEILYNRAALAAHWTVTFCERNAQTCTVAHDAWGQFVKKAQFGASLAYDTLAEQMSSGPYAGSEGQVSRPLETGTLKPADLEPNWRGRNTRPAQKAPARLDGRSVGPR